MSSDASPPLILTLKLDAIAFAHLNHLRQQYFPPERNWLPAHVTLFHALPSDQRSAIDDTLQSLCQQTPILPLHLPTPRFLGKGVAIDLHCPVLIHLRQQLASRWRDWLSAQDRQGFRPHITIQNKVPPDSARQLYQQLLHTWQPLDAQGEGLLLWRYLGGPWELLETFTFLQSAPAK